MKIIKWLLLTVGVLAAAVNVEARRAVLVAHYGSSDDDTRAKTINRISADIAEALPGYDVREAYISPVVRRNMERRGLKADSPLDALLKLRADGYDTVYVQPTTLLDGEETAAVKEACRQTEGYFALLKCGESLCYSPEDCEAVIAVLVQEPAERNEAVVYAGHGNMLPSTATYSQLDYMFAAGGYTGYHVSTIEGYPTAKTTVGQLRNMNKKVKKVKIVPLLLVCGNHTKVDIAGEFAGTLQEAGYQTEVVYRGLGEVAAIRQLYVERVKKLIE